MTARKRKRDIPLWEGEATFVSDLTPDECRAVEALSKTIGNGAQVRVIRADFARLVAVSLSRSNHNIWLGPLPAALSDAVYN